jgi:hypothetical protein
MLRTTFALLGGLLALFPERSLDVYERLFFANADDAERRRGLSALVRAEGLVFALAGVSGGRAYDRLIDAVGVAGAVVLVAPRQYLGVGGRIAYANDVEWNEWVVGLARALGGLYVSLALAARRLRD